MCISESSEQEATYGWIVLELGQNATSLTGKRWSLNSTTGSTLS
jgi:hypothetical protein